MAEIHVNWIGEKNFVAIDSTQHSAVLSPPGGIGVKPSEGLLLALASCACVDVVEIIAKQRATLLALNVVVTAEQDSEPPWKFQCIHLHFNARAEKLKAEQFQRAVDLALNKYCSVRASLHPDIAVSFEAVLE